MKLETISKNEARMKNQISRGNFIKQVFLFCFVLCVSMSAWGQNYCDDNYTNNQIEMTKATMKNSMESVQIYAAENMHKLAISSRCGAYKAILATKNPKVIAAANECLDKIKPLLRNMQAKKRLFLEI